MPLVANPTLAAPRSAADMPALRHYDYAFKFYGAVKSHKLTVRAVSEVGAPPGPPAGAPAWGRRGADCKGNRL